MNKEPDMTLEELMKILDPTRDQYIENFLASGIGGIEVDDVKSMELLVGKRPFIISRGKVCNKPQPVLHSDLVDNEDVKVLVRNGKMFLINRKAANK